LLASYFENPVVAPVYKVAPVEKIVEKVNENKPVEESKSIWSNFTEVLKRPPREKILKPAVQKKEEEEEEAPKQLTMFDLIKSRMPD
jgi:hypothetical protein